MTVSDPFLLIYWVAMSFRFQATFCLFAMIFHGFGELAAVYAMSPRLNQIVHVGETNLTDYMGGQTSGSPQTVQTERCGHCAIFCLDGHQAPCGMREPEASLPSDPEICEASTQDSSDERTPVSPVSFDFRFLLAEQGELDLTLVSSKGPSWFLQLRTQAFFDPPTPPPQFA